MRDTWTKRRCAVGLFAMLCLLPVHAQVPPADNAVSASTPMVSPGGTTLKLPPGWRSSQQGDLLVLRPPEPDLRLAVMDLGASDAASAVAQAWAAFDPGFKWPLRSSTRSAPRAGWEERHFFSYDIPPNEKAEARAYAWRSGSQWTVVLVSGSSATVELRSGPMQMALASARPKGYQRETFAGRSAHPLDAQRIAALRTFVAEGMRRLQIPGVALSLIEDHHIVYQGGLGVRRLGSTQPVDADTLFLAASNTKALTTLLMAEQVDARALRWDEPVTEAYPAFRLGDADTTRQVQMRHLVCACTGVPRQDLEWSFNFSHARPEQVIAAMAATRPTSAFGEVFQYSNEMAAVAGYVAASHAMPGKPLGEAYDAAMSRDVLLPLGMSRSTFDFARALRDNHASPHDVDVDGRVMVGVMDQNYSIVPLRPAGGLWTSAHELSQYVLLELAQGLLPDGRRLVSAQNLLQRHVPNVVISEDIEYGMGLVIDRRWGIPVIHHGGELPGYHSDMIWLPEHGIGAVILSNSDNGWALLGPSMRKLVELLFDGKPEADAQLDAAVTQLASERRDLRSTLSVPADPASTRRLAARYRNPVLGELRVRRHGGELLFDMGELHSRYASRRNPDGSISYLSISPTVQGYEYVAGAHDGKRTLTIRDAQHEYVYTEFQ